MPFYDCLERIKMNLSKSEKTIKYILTAVNVILLALTVLGVIKTCFVGFDIDEGYAIAQSYRMLTGDKLFAEMWEPHQMSAFGLAIIMLPYLLLTGGKTAGIILYARIMGSVIHLLIGWWFYKTAKRKFGTTPGLFVLFAHVNFLPKWLVLAEFEIMQYWAVCILFLALLTWYDSAVGGSKETVATVSEKPNKKGFGKWCKADGWLIIAGIALFVAMMTYPTMILLYPVYVIFFLTLKAVGAKQKWRSVLIFTGTTLIIGMVFLAYLRTYMTVEEFLRYVSYIFMDESHSESLATRFLYYQKEWKGFCEDWLVYLLWTVINALVISGVDLMVGKCSLKDKSVAARPDSQGNGRIWKTVCKYGIILLISWLIVFMGSHIWGSLLEDKNQFYLYYRFMFIALAGTIFFAIGRGRSREYFMLGILPGIVGVIASVLVTNMALEITMARMYIAVMATFFIGFELLRDKFNKEMVVKAVCYMTMVVFILGLIVSKLILVRVTGCMPVTVRMDMEWVKEGPAAGLLIDDELAWQFNENVPLIEEYVNEKDKLLYFGCENIYYMVSDGTLATPSVQGTTVFNEMFLEYYKEYPERIPNVVIVDKTFETNPYYNYKPENQVVVDWINENFADAEKTETNYFIILRR